MLVKRLGYRRKRTTGLINLLWPATFLLCVGGIAALAIGQWRPSHWFAGSGSGVSFSFSDWMPEFSAPSVGEPSQPTPARPSRTRPSQNRPPKNTLPATKPELVEPGTKPTVPPKFPATPKKMVWIEGGTFQMGSDQSDYSSEKPAHLVTVRGFWIDPYEVTNGEFSRFVQATSYQTTAERQGWGPVFNYQQGQWQSISQISWRQPFGPGVNLENFDLLPVVQVSWEDANAYAKWAGKRLPTEAEWEYAARGNLANARFSWGNRSPVRKTAKANLWQGTFPQEDLGSDGYAGLAPVGSYTANGFGLYDMSGNVWEWCQDWFKEDAYRTADPQNPRLNPQGPPSGEYRVQRGGSWLSSPTLAPGAFVYSRISAPPQTMFSHVGFRCVKD
ncbi:FGE-sulfatase domain-containing protein [Planctomycetales bacterium 10988]|nr:FGE-sulfatase domain-containing protein [Planctomycetales bacterium 10988]